MPQRPESDLGRERRRGIVAIIFRDDRFLVIRRSAHVVAPRAYCFPGGHLEAGETEPQALVRELQEELGVHVRPIRRVWQSETPWGVELAWWLADMESTALVVPNAAEVETVHWLTAGELLALPGLLESNRQFLRALADAEIDLTRTEAD